MYFFKKDSQSWKYDRFYDLMQNANKLFQRAVLIYNAARNICGYSFTVAPLGLGISLWGGFLTY